MKLPSKLVSRVKFAFLPTNLPILIDLKKYLLIFNSPIFRHELKIVVKLTKKFLMNANDFIENSKSSNNINNSQILPHDHRESLLFALKARFAKHSNRHQGMEWTNVLARLEASPEKLWSLHEMESTGGEPDVIGFDEKTGEFIFYDCSAESPKGRRSLCYDRKALDARKEHKPVNSALDMAASMGIEILTEEQYRDLQMLGIFDTKTSSWVNTPAAIRKHGGAIFCDRRYEHVFTYHNGAESYYAARGFRGSLRV